MKKHILKYLCSRWKIISNTISSQTIIQVVRYDYMIIMCIEHHNGYCIKRLSVSAIQWQNENSACIIMNNHWKCLNWLNNGTVIKFVYLFLGSFTEARRILSLCLLVLGFIEFEKSLFGQWNMVCFIFLNLRLTLQLNHCYFMI